MQKFVRSLIWELKIQIHSTYAALFGMGLCTIILWLLPVSVCDYIEIHLQFISILLVTLYLASLIYIPSKLFYDVREDWRLGRYELQRLMQPSIHKRVAIRTLSNLILETFVVINFLAGRNLVMKFSGDYVSFIDKCINAPFWFPIIEFGFILPSVFRFTFLQAQYKKHRIAVLAPILFLFYRSFCSENSLVPTPFLLQIPIAILCYYFANRMEEKYNG